MSHEKTTQDIRDAFFEFFKREGHSLVPSSSTIPYGDKTLLFTNAGMNQFKDVFLGQSKRGYSRATSSQKCIRAGGKHNDLENVGHTRRHLTFFEMIGNFSFGDYFKKEAIEFSYRVSTEVFGLDKSKIWVSVFRDDDEAYAMWEEYVKDGRLPQGHIVRMDEADNFWSMGDTGPCGPSSELYYDRGEKYGDATNPANDEHGDRFVEFWNLVFMQFDRDHEGNLSPLPKPSIDTGAGLERVMTLIHDVDSIFETDVLRGIISKVEEISGVSYDTSDENQKAAFRVIADHIRSLAFTIADGAIPSNLDRGYVLRKILRRAFRHGKLHLGLNKPFLADVFPRLKELMGKEFPELIEQASHICEILSTEESNFIRTLDRGGNYLSELMENSKGEISGADAFKLKDTYGFPLEEILLILKDANLTLNLDEFYLLEEEAKERSRGARDNVAHTVNDTLFEVIENRCGKTEFNGYEEFEDNSSIVAIIKDGVEVDKIVEGEKAEICLARTPFYAEGGGQVGDSGMIYDAEDERIQFRVTDVQKTHNIHRHIGVMEKGMLHKEDKAFVKIDLKRRRKTENNHTATHLLHWALCKHLGAHIKQEGSLVEEDRLRFDFSHTKPLTIEQTRAIEEMVNEKIRENTAVSWHELNRDEALNQPDVKHFFGDKYGSIVRLVHIDFSRELCGGTHATHLGKIGLFRIAKESSVSAGVRRIEAVTGLAAEKFMQSIEDIGMMSADMLKTTPQKLTEKISSLQSIHKQLQADLKKMKTELVAVDSSKFLGEVEHVGETPFIAKKVSYEPAEMNLLADQLMDRCKSLVLVLASSIASDKCHLIVRVSKDLQDKISAKEIVDVIGPEVGGRGGGRPGNAQAGGSDPVGIPKALEAARECVQKKG